MITVVDYFLQPFQTLLKNGADGGEDTGKLLMIAARSKTTPDLKLRCLKDSGAACDYKDKKGLTVLHAVALSSTATKEVLECCTDTFQLKANLKDDNCNTPLHIAAENTHSCSELLVEKLSSKKHEGDPNALNKKKRSPLQMVLQSHSDKELRRKKVILLLKNGCTPTFEDIDKYEGDAEDFKELFLSTEVYTKSHNTFQFLLVLAQYCKARLTQSADWTTSLQWRNVNVDVEDAAVSMINELGKREKAFRGWELTSKYFQDVHKLGWNKVSTSIIVTILLV